MKGFFSFVPGFRSNVLWKKIVAIIGYLLMLLFLIPPVGSTMGDKIVTLTQRLLFLGIPFILITNVAKIRDKLPLFKTKTKPNTIIGAILASVLLLVVIGSLSNLYSPQYKTKNAAADKAATDKKAADKAAADKAAADKAAADKAAADKAAADKAAADKVAADKAAADKAAADKAAAEKAAADKAAADKAAADKAAYYAQFSWYNSDFGVINDSAKTDEFGFTTIKGRLIAFNKSYTYLQISYGLYSSDGSKIGTALANINNLSKGTTWKFSAIGSSGGNGSVKYKVEEVTGW